MFFNHRKVTPYLTTQQLHHNSFYSGHSCKTKNMVCEDVNNNLKLRCRIVVGFISMRPFQPKNINCSLKFLLDYTLQLKALHFVLLSCKKKYVLL